MDLKQRTADIAAELEVLQRKRKGERSVYVVSLRRRDKYQQEGRVFIVPLPMAARLVVDGTHDYASADQIAAYEADQEARSRQIREQAAREEQKFSINLSPDLIAQAVKASAAKS